MRTISKEPNGAIAVEAQQSELSPREPLSLEPSIEAVAARTSIVPPMLSASPIDMVNRKEFSSSLTAAATFVAIGGKCFKSDLSNLCAVMSLEFFSIRLPVFVVRKSRLLLVLSFVLFPVFGGAKAFPIRIFAKVLNCGLLICFMCEFRRVKRSEMEDFTIDAKLGSPLRPSMIQPNTFIAGFAITPWCRASMCHHSSIS